jgi:hypothetical protein
MGALTSHAIMATLEKDKLRYDLAKDLVPVAVAGSVPLVWVVTPSLPVKSLPELVACAKASPGKLTCASSGRRSTTGRRSSRRRRSRPTEGRARAGPGVHVASLRPSFSSTERTLPSRRPLAPAR